MSYMISPSSYSIICLAWHRSLLLTRPPLKSLACQEQAAPHSMVLHVLSSASRFDAVPFQAQWLQYFVKGKRAAVLDL